MRESWATRQPSLYSRRIGDHGKIPKLWKTSGYTDVAVRFAFFQWISLEDQIAAGNLPENADQFNGI
ncbi:hypothetical protein ACNKHW_19235 [Shigella flexneri]